jgi:hypothetical protein
VKIISPLSEPRDATHTTSQTIGRFLNLSETYTQRISRINKVLKSRGILLKFGILLEIHRKELDGPADTQRVIAEAKQRSQRPAIGWVTKIYYLELLCASDDTFSHWSRLHLQSLAPTPVSRRVDVRQAAGLKNNCQIFITT